MNTDLKIRRADKKFVNQVVLLDLCEFVFICG